MDTQQFLDGLTTDNIYSDETFAYIASLPNVERVKVLTQIKSQAKDLGISIRDFKRLLSDHQAAQKRDEPQTINDYNGYCTGSWIVDNTGVYKYVDKTAPNGDTKTIKVVASYTPFVITAIYNYSDGNIDRSYKLAVHNRQFNISADIIASSQKIVALHRIAGIEINSNIAKNTIDYISDFLRLNADKLAKVQLLHYLGWYGTEIVPYSEAIKTDTDNPSNEIYKAFAERGSLQTWIDTVKPLRDNIIVRIILAASVASLLIRPTNSPCFTVHVWGQSQYGKTIALRIAASVWGRPQEGHYIQTYNATNNNLMSTCGILNDYPMIIDEYQTKAVRNADSIIYCHSTGKSRGGNNKDNTPRPVYTWSNIIISSGEQPLTTHISDNGAKMRTIELQTTTPIIPTDLQSKTVKTLLANYGLAAKTIVTMLRRFAPEQLTERALYYEQELNKINPASQGKQNMSMSLIIMADRLLDVIFKSPHLELGDVKPYLKNASDVDKSLEAWQFTTNWIAENQNNFIRQDAESNTTPYTGKIYGKLVRNNDTKVTTCYILANTLRLVLEQAGFNFEQCKNTWINKGYLVTFTEGKLTKVIRFPQATATCRCCLLNISDKA